MVSRVLLPLALSAASSACSLGAFSYSFSIQEVASDGPVLVSTDLTLRYSVSIQGYSSYQRKLTFGDYVSLSTVSCSGQSSVFESLTVLGRYVAEGANRFELQFGKFASDGSTVLLYASFEKYLDAQTPYSNQLISSDGIPASPKNRTYLGADSKDQYFFENMTPDLRGSREADLSLFHIKYRCPIAWDSSSVKAIAIIQKGYEDFPIYEDHPVLPITLPMSVQEASSDGAYRVFSFRLKSPLAVSRRFLTCRRAEAAEEGEFLAHDLFIPYRSGAKSKTYTFQVQVSSFGPAKDSFLFYRTSSDPESSYGSSLFARSYAGKEGR